MLRPPFPLESSCCSNLIAYLAGVLARPARRLTKEGHIHPFLPNTGALDVEGLSDTGKGGEVARWWTEHWEAWLCFLSCLRDL